MYIQQRYLKNAAAFASATTGLETIDLPRSGLLMGLELRVWGTNGNDGNKPDIWLHDRMKTIEIIVNGSKVVKRFEGNQLLADMLYKKTPHYSHDMKNMNAGSAEEFFFINFGRFYHDLDYMLDLSRVNDPELRIDYDFGMTGANGWTNGVAMAAAPSYSLIPHILRESTVVPKGYFKTAEIARFTSGPSKQENMKLAIGPTYANLYLQSWYASHGITGDVDNISLNINSDDVIPYKVEPTELLAQLVRTYGLFEMLQQVNWKNAQAFPHPIESGRVEGLFAIGVDAEVYGFDLWANAIPAGVRKTSDALAQATSVPAHTHYKGCLPFSIAAIPIFDLMDERTWIDSSKLGDLWLRVEETAGAATGTVKLLADEVVTRY